MAELYRVSKEGGRNCRVVTDKPCMHFFVDGTANFGLNSSKKSIVVAQCNDVEIKGTTAKLQVSITAPKDANRVFDDITTKAQPIVTGVYVSMLPGTDKRKILHIRLNFEQIVNVNPNNKQVINISQRNLSKHCCLILNATVTSPDGFTIEQMAEKPDEPPAEEEEVAPPPPPPAPVVVEAPSPAVKQPPTPVVVEAPPSPKAESPKISEPSTTRSSSETAPGRLMRSQSIRMEPIDENFTVDNSDKRFVRVIVTFDPSAVSGDRLALNRGFGGIGYNILVTRTDRSMGNAGPFRPAPKSHNLEFTEDATRRQLVLRFDRSKDVTEQSSKSQNATSSRVCSTTEGVVVMGCADVKFVAMYVVDELKDNAYNDAVYTILHPRPQHGLTNLDMKELVEEVILKLNIRQPTAKNYAAIRDATRAYLSNVNLRRSNNTKYRSHDF